MIPAMTAAGVARSRKSSGRRPASLIGPSRRPLSARMIFHEIVRSRKLVKNGAMTRNSRTFLYAPPRKAIAYASGKPSAKARIVASAPYTIERASHGQYSPSASG